MPLKPSPNFHDALGVKQDVSAETIKRAYRRIAKEMHPDAGNGETELFKLITAAYQGLKDDPARPWGQRGDATWQQSYLKATAKPKAERPKAEGEFVFEDIEGESKQDRRRRYARTRQAFRYQTDPEYAAARRASSVKSHKASRERAKAAKNAPAASA